jgi:hypothetical protein
MSVEAFWLELLEPSMDHRVPSDVDAEMAFRDVSILSL